MLLNSRFPFVYDKWKSKYKKLLNEVKIKMELAIIAFRKMIVMFIILIVGIIAYKTKIISKEGNTTLSNLLLLIVNPFVIFMGFQMEYTYELFVRLWISIGFAFICHIIAIVISYIAIGKGAKDFEIERVSAIYSNCGFIGIPIINALFGQEGVFYLASYIAVFNILLWTQGYMLMTGQRDKKVILKGILSPCVIAAILGIVCFSLRISLFDEASEAFDKITDMNTPLAMIVAGVTIAQSDIKKALANIRLYFVCIIKLFIIPVVCAAVLMLFRADYVLTMTSIVEIACPVGASCTMFAIRYNKNAVYASELYTVSTLFSAVSLPIVIMIAEMIGALVI